MKLELHSIPQISQHAICQPTLAGPDPEHALYQRPEGPLPLEGGLCAGLRVRELLDLSPIRLKTCVCLPVVIHPFIHSTNTH